MKHPEVMSIPIGSKIVVSERVDELERANLTNSIIATLESHDNYEKSFWNGIYWRDMSDTFTKTDPKSRTKHYFVTTEMPQSDGTTTKVKTLLRGKEILGVYNAETQKLWDDEARNREANQLEQERRSVILREAQQRGYREAEQRTVSVRELVESVMGRKFEEDNRQVVVNISCRDANFTDPEATTATPVIAGSVSLDYLLFEELIEKMYAQLDAR